MIINKENKITFTHNDIYILESLNSNIIINDNYNRLIILDKSFKPLSSIEIEQSIYIYSTFKSSDNKMLMLYCPDESVLIKIELNSKKVTFIELKNINHIFSPYYYWQNDILILTSYNGEFYQCMHNDLKPLDQNVVENLCPSLYGFLNKTKNYTSSYQINSLDFNLIYLDNDSNVVTYFDYLTNQKITTTSSITYHDIIYYKGSFAFVSEKCIEVVHNEEKIKLFTESNMHVFLKACFIKTSTQLMLIVLVSDKTNNKVNKLISYQLEY